MEDSRLVSVVCAVLVDFIITPVVDVVEGVSEGDPLITDVASSESPLKKYNLFIIYTLESHQQLLLLLSKLRMGHSSKIFTIRNNGF